MRRLQWESSAAPVALPRFSPRRPSAAASCHPGIEERPDEFEHTFVRHARGDARHQAVVIDSIKKFLKVEVNHVTVALGNVALRLDYCLMGATSRSEAVAVLGKRWVPPYLENLQQRLLDQSVDDSRHAELSDPAVPLGYLDPFDRLRLVSSL
jgi:hypothetical protein